MNSKINRKLDFFSQKKRKGNSRAVEHHLFYKLFRNVDVNKKRGFFHWIVGNNNVISTCPSDKKSAEICMSYVRGS